jgi:hypothetical protein
MAARWKAWKSKDRISPLPTAPWKSRKQREIPTFPQLRRLGCGKVENQKQVSHFPTAIYISVPNKNGRLRRRRKEDTSIEVRMGTFLTRLDMGRIHLKPDSNVRNRKIFEPLPVIGK